MPFKILLILLSLSFLVSCRSQPPEPDIKVCGPVLVYKEGVNPPEIDMRLSYAFCVLRKDPRNKDHWERIILSEYLVGKPRMIKAQDAALLDFWEADLKEWGKRNCRGLN